MRTLLEQRYRYLLRMLPAAYRDDREEEIVATYLEGTNGTEDDELGRPRWSEVVSIAGLALRLRLGGVGAPPRSFAHGQTVRLVALLGVAFLAVSSMYGALSSLHFWYMLPEREQAVTMAPSALGELLGLGMPLAWTTVFVLPLAWLAIFVLLVTGRTSAARWLVLPVLVTHLVLTFTSLSMEALFSDWSAMLFQVAWSSQAILPALALVAGYHADAPKPDRRWLAALPVGLLALAAWSLLPFWLWYVGFLDLYSITLIVAGVTWLRSRHRGPEVPFALFALAVPLLLVRVTTVRGWLGLEPGATRTTIMATSLAEIVALAVIALVLLAAGRRALPAAGRASAAATSTA